VIVIVAMDARDGLDYLDVGDVVDCPAPAGQVTLTFLVTRENNHSTGRSELRVQFAHGIEGSGTVLAGYEHIIAVDRIMVDIILSVGGLGESDAG
jgi:hypothetical protein